jgi:hypothetical protein
MERTSKSATWLPGGKNLGWVGRFFMTTGQALARKIARAVFPFQSAPDRTGKAPAELQVGDKVVMPTQATVVSRFPK